MAKDRMQRHKDEFGEWVDGFDVTVETVIGHVHLDHEGEDPPHVAAFKVIALADQEGTFRYPMSDGRTCAVTVEWEGEVEARS
jgi:hypothetical protein